MRKFDIVFKHKNKNVAYRNLKGHVAIKTMKDLRKKGFKPIALTDSYGYIEILSLKELEDVFIDDPIYN